METDVTIDAVYPLRNGKVSVDFKIGRNRLTDVVPAEWHVKVGDVLKASGQGRLRQPTLATEPRRIPRSALVIVPGS